MGTPLPSEGRHRWPGDAAWHQEPPGAVVAERRTPVVPAGAAPAKRQVSTPKLLIWLAGAVALAGAVFVGILFVGGDGGDSQPAATPATLPPDPEPPATTTTTTPPTTTTAPAALGAIDDPASSAGETEPSESAGLQGDEPATATDGEMPETLAVPPAADAEIVEIRDAGDFGAVMTLQCINYFVLLEWQVDPPYDLPPDAETSIGRVRSPAPLGSAGRLRLEIDTFVPAEPEPESEPETESAAEASGDEEASADDAASGDDANGDGGTADPETSEQEPPEEPDETDAEPGPEAAAEEPTLTRETVLVLEVTHISGRGYDQEGTGESIGMLRHRCPTPTTAEYAEWTLTVEAHAEVAWMLSFAPALDYDDADIEDFIDEAAEEIADEIVDEIFDGDEDDASDEEGAGSTDQ